jgi:hypothetical protein
MAADEDDRGAGPDPWDDIVAGSLGDTDGEPSFRFDEDPREPAAAASPEEPGPMDEGGAPPEPAAVDGAADDALVEDWLTADDGDGGAAVPPLAVFPPDEAGFGTSGIDIGTGASGIALHGAPEQEEIGGESFGQASAAADGELAGWPNLDTSDGEAVDGGENAEAADGGDAEGFPDLTPAAAAVIAAPAAAAAVKRSAKPVKKKSGGIGQVIGVALGGLLSIPITLAILIYGLGKDPFGVTKQIPREAAFLLPAKFRPGPKRPAPGGLSLDSLPTGNAKRKPVREPEVPDAGETAEPTPEPVAPAVPDVATVVEPPVADVTVDPPAVPAPDPVVDAPVVAVPEPVLDPVVDPVVSPVSDPAVTASPEPAVAPVTDVAVVDAPGLDALDKVAADVAPEPPPLDTTALDDAVGEAEALGEALGTVDDKDNRAYRILRTRWYRALARVAEELVAIDHAAATSGRPLAAAPDNVAGLHGVIGGREALVAELAALAPDWLAYAKRGSDGVVLPVTFDSARKVGPYWTTKATLTAADGKTRELTVVSRTEPTATAGDRLVVTGVVLDGAVVWAADVREADAGSQPPSF